MAGRELKRNEKKFADDNAQVHISSRRRHTRFDCDWSSDVCSSDLSGRTACLSLRRARCALGLLFGLSHIALFAGLGTLFGQSRPGAATTFAGEFGRGARAFL